MTKEEKNAEILRLKSHVCKYADDVLRRWRGRLPGGLTKDDVKQHALLLLCEHVEKGRDVRLLKKAVLWGVRDLLRNGKACLRDVGVLSQFKTDGIELDDLRECAVVDELGTNDDVRILRRAVFRATHDFPFFYRAAMRANLLSGERHAWKYSTACQKTFATRRWYLMKRLEKSLEYLK